MCFNSRFIGRPRLPFHILCPAAQEIYKKLLCRKSGGTAAVVYRGPIAYEPLTVLERFLEDFVLPGRVFTFEFFMCAISAVLIITVSSAIGYMYLQRSDVR